MLALTTGPRSIQSGKEFDKFFPLTVLRTDPIVIRSGSVEDSVRVMGQVAEKYRGDTAQISQVLKGASQNETCRNIWNFIYSFVQYQEDREGVEQIRRPARTWADRTSGVDCDCMSVFASSILRNLGITHYFRITKYSQPEFQHVYVIVPNNQAANGYLTIDGVIDGYDKEKVFTEKKDFDMNGIPIQLLNGLGAMSEDPLYEYLKQLQQICLQASAKQIPISKTIACCDAGDLLQYALENWQNPHDRATALETNALLEARNWPDLFFWRTVWDYMAGNATPGDLFKQSYILPSNSINGFGELPPGAIGPELPSGSSGSGSGFNWGDLFKFTSDTLKTISMWGKDPTGTGQQQSYIPPATTSQTAGISNTTLLAIGGVLLLGGIIFFASKSTPSAPKVVYVKGRSKSK